MKNTNWDLVDLKPYLWNPSHICSMDSYENRIGPGYEGQYVLCTYSPLADDLVGESNYQSILFHLRKSFPEYAEHITEVRTGHWTYAHFDSEDLLRECAYIMNGLEGYPLFDDEDYSRREWEFVETNWEGMSLKERIDLLSEHEMTIFAARRDYPPTEYDDSGSLFESLRGL